MEQAPYWMWTKRKSDSMSTHQQQQQQQQPQLQTGGSTRISMAYNNNESSWEEQAFAEDAIGAFGGGGCVWPPRSYSCSFCRREFRSAQALGGHMNVHRRDRARLKQSSPTHLHQSQLDHSIDQNHDLGFGQYPLPSDPVCALVYHQQQHQPNPNHPFLASSWPSRVCGHPDDHDDTSSHAEHHKPTTWANFVVNNTSDPKPQGCNKAKVVDNPKCIQTGFRVQGSMSLNLVLHQTYNPTMSSEEDEDEEEEEAMRRCKKRRRSSNDDASSFPFFLKPTHQARDDHAEAGDEHSSKTTSEDLDLELRLGRPP